MKITAFAYALSKVLTFFSVFPLVNIGFSIGLGFDEIFLKEFLLVFVLCNLPFLILTFLTEKVGKINPDNFGHREAIGVTVFSWFTIPLLASLPFIMSGAIPHFINAVFESASGLSTTGASALSNVESLPKAILFWRSLLHFVGGGGIVLASVVILPGLTSRVFQVEVFAPVGEQTNLKLMEVGKRVWIIFCSLNALLVFLYLLGGMPLFDALCHAFAAIATGGFSPYNDSFGHYAAQGHPSALYFEIVTIVFMFLGSVPMLLIYELTRGNWKGFLLDSQVRFYLIYLSVLSLTISLTLFIYRVYSSLEESLRHGFFTLFSMASTTGYAIEDFSKWPLFTKLIILIVMFVGGSTTSTAGGIKILRFIYVLKVFLRSVKQIIHPHVAYTTRIGSSIISLDAGKSIMNFIICFFVVYISGVLLLSIYEDDFMTVLSAVIACLGSSGPGISSQIGSLGNYAAMQSESKVVLSVFMVLGRIEIIPIFAIFLPRFWRK